MREIVNVQVGQCGNEIGSKFWESIIDEHGLDPAGVYHGESDLQLQRISVYFNEANSKYIPRSVMVDLEPRTIDNIQSGPYGRLYRPESFVFGSGSAGNNWAKGNLSEGSEIIDQILDVNRKEAESCDKLQGFQISHSLGGGCGSGLGCLIMTKLKEEYPNQILESFSIFPSRKISDIVVEPYNAILSIQYLIEHLDICMILDNEAFYEICSKNLKLSNPTYADFNHIASLAMTGITASMRFPGQLNSNLRTLAVNLIPFHRLHFLTPSVAPLFSRYDREYANLTVPELFSQMFDRKHMMGYSESAEEVRYYTAAAVFRGKVSADEIDYQLFSIKNKKSASFVNWIPNSFMSSICDVPSKGLKSSATLLGNSNLFTVIVKRLSEQFGSMFRKKAFLHWYTGEGMCEMDFTEAESNANDILADYTPYECLGAWDEEVYDEEEEIEHVEL